MTTERTTIILGNDDRRAVAVIRQHTGIESRSAAIRYALRETARGIEREKAQKVSLPPVRPPCKSQM